MKQLYKQGDVVIFKAEDEWLSKCIAWLTDSDVCHAAMIYSEDAIVEIGADGVGLHTMEAKEGNMAYLLRLENEPDPEPLRVRADFYINTKTSYDFPALLYLGGLLLYRKFKPSGTVFKIVGKILAGACYALDQLIQKIFYKEQVDAMVCSQFVFQLFRDCGKEYEIRLIPDNSLRDEKYVRLVDLLEQEPENDNAAPFSYRTEAAGFKTEELAEELYRALSGQQDNGTADAEELDYKGLLPPARYLMDHLKELLDKLDVDLPVEALFVTPSDMLYHSENLDRVGMVDIKRIWNKD